MRIIMLKDEFFPSLPPEFLFQSFQELNPLFKEVFKNISTLNLVNT